MDAKPIHVGPIRVYCLCIPQRHAIFMCTFCSDLQSSHAWSEQTK